MACRMGRAPHRHCSCSPDRRAHITLRAVTIRGSDLYVPLFQASLIYCQSRRERPRAGSRLFVCPSPLRGLAVDTLAGSPTWRASMTEALVNGHGRRWSWPAGWTLGLPCGRVPARSLNPAIPSGVAASYLMPATDHRPGLQLRSRPASASRGCGDPSCGRNLTPAVLFVPIASLDWVGQSVCRGLRTAWRTLPIRLLVVDGIVRVRGARADLPSRCAHRRRPVRRIAVVFSPDSRSLAVSIPNSG